MRGEKCDGTLYNAVRIGSPPHARGKELIEYAFENGYRITPTCAGKSFKQSILYDAGKDHPRMRGEKNTSKIAVHFRKGSPPHARGKALRPISLDTAPGITPACAGKSPPAPRVASCAGDHPRMRGEKSTNSTKHNNVKGSPPHARGKEDGPQGGAAA